MIKNIENLKVIYLDQFALSNMVGNISPKWLEIKKLLFENFEKEKIICPFSIEFFLENTGLKMEKAKLIENEFFSISGGYCFKPDLGIYSQEIISKIRKNRITKRTYLTKLGNQTIQSYEKKFEEIKKINEEFSEKSIEASSESNQFVKDYQNVKLDKKTKDILFEKMLSENIEDFILRLSNVINRSELITQKTNSSLGTMDSWIDIILNRLISIHRAKPKELKRLKLSFEKDGFSRFPGLDLRFRLFSHISVNNKKTMPNDFIDITRISSGFSISDIFLTDKQRKNEIIELKFPEKYKTKVFSGKQSDLNLIIKELEHIKTTPNNG